MKKIFITIISLYLIQKLFFEKNIISSWIEKNMTYELADLADKSQIGMKIFKKENNKHIFKLEYKTINDLQIKFELSIVNKSESSSPLKYKGIATNPDPEGMASLDIFDLSGNDNPMEMYICDFEKIKILVLLPLVELEEEYVVINFSDSKSDTQFNEMLIQIRP